MRLLEIGQRIAPALVGNGFRMIATFLLSKYVAVNYGPGGMVMLGQYFNLNGLMANLATGAIENGVIRSVAESNGRDPARFRAVLSASLQIILGLSLLMALVVGIAAPTIARRIFYSDEFTPLVLIMAGSGIFLAGLNWLSSVINGLGDLKRLALVNTLLSGGTIGVVFWTAFFRPASIGIFLSMLALAHVPALFFAWHAFRRYRAEGSMGLRDRWPLGTYTQFAKYSLMSGASALAVPITAILIRNQVVAGCGIDQAGQFEAINRLSGAYLSLGTTTLAMYYLPRLSAAATDGQRAAEMRMMMKLVVPVAALVGLVLCALRVPLFTLLFSAEFAPGRSLMLLQVAGDTLKMASWVLAYQMIARGMVTAFIVCEIGSAVFRLTVTAVFVRWWGLEGAVAGYLVSYVGYGAAMVWLFRDQFRRTA